MQYCKLLQADKTQDEDFIACNKYFKAGKKMTSKVSIYKMLSHYGK